MIAKRSIFREYDIRGVVGSDFDSGLARRLGQAFGTVLKARRGVAPDQLSDLKVGVGRDCRLTGEELANQLIAGLLESGVNVVSCGMGPTPQLYFAVHSLKLDGGIQVTGSHNPPDQNGFKMMMGLDTLSGDSIQELRSKITEFEAAGFSPVHGAANREFAALPAFIAELINRSSEYMGPRKLKVVVDGGNGVGGMAGPAVLRGLGCEVIELYTDPDGRFPNHHPDPTVMENIVELRQRVLDEKADLGIGWDGDADRIGVVDEKGEVVFGDKLLILYGRQLLKEVDKPTIIGDVKCSDMLFSDLQSKGAVTLMAKTGHSLIKQKLKEVGAELAGEMSGHIFFKHRYFGFDDAIHASARLVEILSSSNRSLSEMLSDLPQTFATPEIRVDCADEEKFGVIERAKDAFPEFEVNNLDGLRISFPQGWGLVRASNTQAVLVMRFEATSPELLEEYQTLVRERIAAVRS